MSLLSRVWMGLLSRDKRLRFITRECVSWQDTRTLHDTKLVSCNELVSCLLSRVCMVLLPHFQMSHVARRKGSLVSRMTEPCVMYELVSCFIYKWAMSHVWMVSCLTFEWGMRHVWLGLFVSHINQSCVMYEWVLCLKYKQAMSHVWMVLFVSYVTERCLMYEWVSCLTYEQAMAHAWMRLLSHLWISHV